MSGSSKRDLRTGSPLWLARAPEGPDAAHLAMNESADAVVVGGGVSGALVADALLRSGLAVIAVDRRGFVEGSSPASTALLQFELDEPLTKLREAIGNEHAARAYWRSALAVDYLRGRIVDLALRCGFQERATAYLPGNVLKKGRSSDWRIPMRSCLRSIDDDPRRRTVSRPHTSNSEITQFACSSSA